MGFYVLILQKYFVTIDVWEKKVMLNCFLVVKKWDQFLDSLLFLYYKSQNWTRQGWFDLHVKDSNQSPVRILIWFIRSTNQVYKYNKLSIYYYIIIYSLYCIKILYIITYFTHINIYLPEIGPVLQKLPVR